MQDTFTWIEVLIVALNENKHFGSNNAFKFIGYKVRQKSLVDSMTI